MDNIIRKITPTTSRQPGIYATARITVLTACLAMQKKQQGDTISLFFCYAWQADNTTLHAAQAINLA